MTLTTPAHSSSRPPSPWTGSQHHTRDRWQLDLVGDLAGAAEALRDLAIELTAAHTAGWWLVRPMDGGHLLAARASRRQRGRTAQDPPQPVTATPAAAPPWRLRIVDEPAVAGEPVFDPAHATRTPVLAWSGQGLRLISGPEVPADVLAAVGTQVTRADLASRPWGLAPARVGPGYDLVAAGSRLRAHAVQQGALVRTQEVLTFQHAADGARTLLEAAAAYERLAADAEARAAAGGRLVGVDDGFLHVAYDRPVREEVVGQSAVRTASRHGEASVWSGAERRRHAPRTTTFDSSDGTRLAYHQVGEGRLLVCLPGGPMQASAYLGELGGVSAHRSLVLLDLRGTGGSAVPADTGSYRCDRQVDDVERLRRHLGLDRLDLAAHSAGASLALLYAARHPDRIGRLALITPSPRPVGVEVTDLDRRRVAERRRSEPWFPNAFAAFERIWSRRATAADWEAIAPFTYGRWDSASQAHHARAAPQRNADAAAAYYAAGAVDVGAVRSALAGLRAPVLLIAGEHDIALPPERAAAYVGLAPRAELAVLPGGGHFPWLDDPEWLVDSLATFLR